MLLSYVPCGEGLVFAAGDDIPFAGTCLDKADHEGPHRIAMGGIGRDISWTVLGDGRTWPRNIITEEETA